MTKEEASMIGFEIVAYSGDARSKLLLAVEKAKQKEFGECDKLIAEANECLMMLINHRQNYYKWKLEENISILDLLQFMLKII